MSDFLERSAKERTKAKKSNIFQSEKTKEENQLEARGDVERACALAA